MRCELEWRVKNDCVGDYRLILRAETSNAEARRFLRKLAAGQVVIIRCENEIPGYSADERMGVDVILRPPQP